MIKNHEVSKYHKDDRSRIFYKSIFALMILSSVFLLAGCARTKYVCYNGDIQEKIEKCPVLPNLLVDDLGAQRIADNYGLAVANAKHDSYTRVNTYTKNSTWYANVLFTNIQSGNISSVLLKINGQTGDVSCVTGCEYLTVQDIVPNTTQDAAVVDINY